MIKPIINPHVPVCGFSLKLASGIKSSATTNNIAPAEKARSHGCNTMRCEARKNPTIADNGSTTPLPIPKRNAFLLLPVTCFIGNEIAAPSGKFCMPIPIASPNADIYAAVSPATAAAPKANPTAKPSGMLCKVTAKNNFNDFEKWERGPSSWCVPLCMCGTILSNKAKINPPIIMLVAAGNQANLPKLASDMSIEGIINDHIEAATIIPPANPKNIELTFCEMFFLKKNTNDEPNVVIINMIEKPIMVINVLFILNNDLL